MPVKSPLSLPLSILLSAIVLSFSLMFLAAGVGSAGARAEQAKFEIFKQVLAAQIEAAQKGPSFKG